VIKSILSSFACLALLGVVFVSPEPACDEDGRKQVRASSTDSNSPDSFFAEGEDVMEVFLRPGFAQACGCVQQFALALEMLDYGRAVGFYEKALEHYPAFRWPCEIKTGEIYLRLEEATTSEQEKEIYLEKATKIYEKAMLKNKKLDLEELRVVRDLAMRKDDLVLLSQMNQKIMSLVGAPTSIKDVVPLFFQSFKEENYTTACQMWKILLGNKNVKGKISDKVAALGFELCFFQKDYRGVAQTLRLVRDKKSFFAKKEIYLYCAYDTFLELGQYNALLAIMMLCPEKHSLREVDLIACLSELQKDYKGALAACERLIQLDPTRASYEKAIDLCARAVKAMSGQAQKQSYIKKSKYFLQMMPKDTHLEGETASSASHKKKTLPTSGDIGRVIRRLIAEKYMKNADDLWARMPEGASPELQLLQEQMGVHYKACSVSFEAINGGEASITVSDMYGHVEKMEKILKLVAAEKEKVRLANKRLRERENSSVKAPVLFQAQPVNLRKEVLEGHGLSQKREKPENVEDDAPVITMVTSKDDTPHDITWQWTPKSQKQRDALSIEAQEKLNTFMAEVTRNPWSVRRDGSLALGEPRFVTGSLFGQNTYERDMDAYNRFIYNVTATGPKSARVMILGVQGHL
jgi:tetratricopeptide (TPR) repeat protein